MQLRIGRGYDLHRLVNDRPLIMAGLEIPHYLGLDGHSDADVVTHAFVDAILSACGKGDIGRMFPDTDPALKDADSIELLKKVVEVVTEKGSRPWSSFDAAITIIAQKPKMAPHIEQMQRNLERAAGLDSGQVRISAKTNEGVGPEGREEAISVHAVVLLGF